MGEKNLNKWTYLINIWKVIEDISSPELLSRYETIWPLNNEFDDSLFNIEKLIMKQTKKKSLFEVGINVGIGFLVSYGSLFIIFPILGIESNASLNVVITLYFTILSILRGYIVRRYFNKK